MRDIQSYIAHPLFKLRLLQKL